MSFLPSAKFSLLLLMSVFLFSCGTAEDSSTGPTNNSGSTNSSNQSGTDNTDPSAVSGLIYTSSRVSVTLNWNPATDNVGIDHYRVLRDGVSIGQTSQTTFVDGAVDEGQTYDYRVDTYDAAGNSASSDSVSVEVADNSSGGGLKAFPSAQGFGANATGGRGGQVIKVTNLNADGAGSLQAALNVNAPRIIVFEVSGVIEGFVTIPYGDVTIAGQTAPGAGITIHGVLECDYGSGPDNIIMRHIRIRGNNSFGPNYIEDAFQCARSSNMIFDHISVSGGLDETLDLYESQNVTVQWSSITRSEGHSYGNHNLGMLNGPDGNRISIHHNLMAHHNTRAPAVANGPAEIINNLVYNVGIGFVHHNPASGDFNMIGNYYREGPSASLQPFFFDDESNGSGSPALSYYLNDNYVDDPGDYVGSVDNPWSTPYAHSSFANIDWNWNSGVARTDTKHNFDSVNITTHASEDTYDIVLAQAGAFPRDAMDNENIQEVQDRSGTWGARRPTNLMQGLTAGSARTDSDDDGIPDYWETAHGLSNSTDDTSTVMSSGYTAIEEYINELADQLI